MRRIVIMPHEIVFKEIDKFFCLKHASYKQEIKQLTGKRNNTYINLFIEKLFEQASHKTRTKQDSFVYEITIEELAYQLRLDNAIKERKKKRINDIVTNCIDIAIKLDYLTEYQRDVDQKGVDKLILHLNKARFYNKPTSQEKQA